MLTELTISNLAIIERQSLSFHPRFNVISGETGAGKSIILNALEFILGGKLPLSAIRLGAEVLEVQALFDLRDVPSEIKAELPDLAQGEELVVSRTLPREGRGKILINGRLGTVALLEEIVRKLVNICSQHHHTRLLDPKYHLELLDGFCVEPQSRDAIRESFLTWSQKAKELKGRQDGAARVAARRGELEDTLQELSLLSNLRAGRRTELEVQIKRMSSAEKLVTLSSRASDGISGDDGVLSRLKEVSAALMEMERLDPAAAGMVKECELARAAVLESERGIARYIAAIEVDGVALEELREELSELARLERKYRTDDTGLLALREKITGELRGIGGDDSLSAMEAEVVFLSAELKKHAERLTKARKRGAKELCQRVSEALGELNMRDARLDVRFTEVEMGTAGADRVEFLISSNKGELCKPLVEIASGGELSRVMLVLKKLLRERSGVNVLIFDEVDAGVSGGVARSVGVMLQEIAQASQVVCITHLPQVASLSDRHFLVNKEVGERAVTVVKQLSEAEKVDEIARMLAGYQITDASRASARELIASKP